MQQVALQRSYSVDLRKAREAISCSRADKSRALSSGKARNPTSQCIEPAFWMMQRRPSIATSHTRLRNVLPPCYARLEDAPAAPCNTAAARCLCCVTRRRVTPPTGPIGTARAGMHLPAHNGIASHIVLVPAGWGLSTTRAAGDGSRSTQRRARETREQLSRGRLTLHRQPCAALHRKSSH